MKKIDLVILAGGRGTRLGTLTKKVPKPLVKINGIPFIQHLINIVFKYIVNMNYTYGFKFIPFIINT